MKNNQNTVIALPFPNINVSVLIDEKNGAINGCCAGITEYTTDICISSIEHQDQEGIFVLSGSGIASVGDHSFPVHSGDCWLVPAHTPHSLKKSKEDLLLKVFWFHAY